MLNKNIQTFIACDCEYENANIVLFGAGYDGTTSFRAGTRFAPSAIRNESFGIETYSLYQDKDMTDYSFDNQPYPFSVKTSFRCRRISPQAEKCPQDYRDDRTED